MKDFIEDKSLQMSSNLLEILKFRIESSLFNGETMPILC